MKPTIVAALAACLVLVGCSSDDGPTAANDPAGSSAGDTSSPTPGSEETQPTAEPTVGTYPTFDPQDYSYTLRVSCFCADAGNAVRVKVVAGKAVEATWSKTRNGDTKGDPAPDYRRITINTVIDAANDTEAAQIDVTWPAGQDYPTSVYIDQDTMMADEEIGYDISDVVVA